MKSLSKVVVVVPSIREECLKRFMTLWKPLFAKHAVHLVVVVDGDDPYVIHWGPMGADRREYAMGKVLECCGVKDSAGLIFNRNDGVRNLGFLAARRLACECEVILTLDDDCFPTEAQGAGSTAGRMPAALGDPIQEHLDALNRKVPISWFAHAVLADGHRAEAAYFRGFPYGVREEAEVWVSHGVWEGVRDWDGPSQLVNGNPEVSFYKGPVPKGCLIPVCGMNLAFRIEALPWLYFAPMGKAIGVQRFADIWMGIRLKRALDEMGKAMVTGYSVIHHSRASNVFANLEQEARGILMNEEAWKGGAFAPYHKELEGYAALYDKGLQKWVEAVEAAGS
jgi:hypothetical protein